MYDIKIKEPRILENVFSNQEYLDLKKFLQEYPKESMDYDESLGRYLLTHSFIDDYANKLLPIARDIFESDTLLSSYSLFSHYEGHNANLFRHVDNNACTYTIDLCVYQTEPWGLGVRYNGEDKEYILEENQALAYYGNDQEHWRGEFPNPDSQHVAMIFFHFVEEDHWWFTRGRDYIEVIRGAMSEESFKNIYGR